MTSTEIKSKILKTFPDFKKSQLFIDELIEAGSILDVPSGTVIINTGEFIKVIPFLIDGLIKIYREDDEGNEILLYYINSGESCVISITASMRNETSSIKALVEEDSTVFAVPNDQFQTLLNSYNLLHSFTYDLFDSKYNQLLDSIDSLAFSDMRSRLMSYLQKEAKSKGVKELHGLTHRQIANDLSSSREVISRLIAILKKEGTIELSGKKIILK